MSVRGESYEARNGCERREARARELKKRVVQSISNGVTAGQGVDVVAEAWLQSH